MSAPNDIANGVLLADVGGTNVRFAILSGGVSGPIVRLPANDYARFEDALAAFLGTYSVGRALGGAVLAVAGVVENERCSLTNNPWIVDAKELRGRFGFSAIRLVNDFEAIGWALPHLGAGEVEKIGGGEPVPDAPTVVLGPGTGLGAAAYLPQDNRVLRSEAGHVAIAGVTDREHAVIGLLRRRYGRVSAERALSGPGLENLYGAVAALDGINAPTRNAAEITEAAMAGTCAASRAALDLFCSLLGAFAGDLALTFGARGGVYIAGGIAPQIRSHLSASAFRSRFEDKGRMGGLVASIPAFIILREEPAFLGLQALGARLLSDG